MTYQDAINQGYTIYDKSYQSGYVSRKADLLKAVVHTAKGNRKGEQYILAPCWRSTRYCYRLYIRKEN